MACYAGVTSENVAARYGISRAQQDEMAARSHKRAAEARASGRFKDEIVPVKTILKDKEVRCHPQGGQQNYWPWAGYFASWLYFWQNTFMSVT